MVYTSMLTPLVAVSGIGSSDEVAETSKGQLLDEITLREDRVTGSPVLDEFARKLKDLSKPPGPWNPRLSREDRINFRFCNSISVPSRSAKPSVLSPRNVSCKYPIFTEEWIKKYLVWLPTVSIVFYNVPSGEDEEDELVETLIATRDKLAVHGIHFTAVVTGSDADLARVMPFLRKQTGLSPKRGLLALPDDLNNVELEKFVDTVYQVALAESRDFFGNKMLMLREKRNAVAPPLDLLVWDARYTLKLAYCSEFKGDLAGANKLYESAYDSLALLFENRAITIDSPAYNNAREVLDAVAFRIFQHALPSRLAFEKLLIHLSTIEEVWKVNGIDKCSPNALHWRSVQHFRFAELCQTMKQSGLGMTAVSQHPAGTPTGLIWLDAANLLASQPKLDTKDDPYEIETKATNPNALKSTSSSDGPIEPAPQIAYLNAISELSEFKRAKAFALSKYGEWLSKTDPDSNASLQAFKSAKQTLPAEAWPEVQRYLSNRLGDKFTLFMLGDVKEFPASTGQANINSAAPLFNCTGTFEDTETHIGRGIRAQVTLVPRFSGKMTLKALQIHHTLGVVRFENEDPGAAASEEKQYLVTASSNDNKGDQITRACLEFDEQQPRTFQFLLTSVETGDIELLHVDLDVEENYTLKLPIEQGSGEWLLRNGQPSPRSIKHLLKMENPLKVHVHTRPAKLDIADKSPSIAAVGEKFKFSFELKSKEEEDIEPEITVALVKGEPDAFKKTLVEVKKGAETLVSNGPYVAIEGMCDVPSSVFVLAVTARFNTSSDTLPVVFEYNKEVDVVKPFRVSFDLVPEHHNQVWPAMFAPAVDLPQIARKWRLSSTILSLFAESDLLLHSSQISIECDTANFEIEQPSQEVEQYMHHNSIKRVSHRFISRYKTEEGISQAKNFEASAFVSLIWSRKSEPSIKNTFTLTPVRLNLPTQEPRVLVVADKKGTSAEISQVTYHIENATPRLLNFSISMSSSTYYAFQGPKAVTIRMLPYSTRALTYQLTPLGDGEVQNKRPLPDLRVYDINYKRTLAILPGDDNVTFHQGSLFL